MSANQHEPNELFQTAKPKATFGRPTDDKVATKQQRAAAEQMNLTELLGIEGPASAGTGLDFGPSPAAASGSAPVARTTAPTKAPAQQPRVAASQPSAQPSAAPSTGQRSAPPRPSWFARLLAWFRG